MIFLEDFLLQKLDLQHVLAHGVSQRGGNDSHCCLWRRHVLLVLRLNHDFMMTFYVVWEWARAGIPLRLDLHLCRIPLKQVSVVLELSLILAESKVSRLFHDLCWLVSDLGLRNHRGVNDLGSRPLLVLKGDGTLLEFDVLLELLEVAVIVKTHYFCVVQELRGDLFQAPAVRVGRLSFRGHVFLDDD